MKSGQIFGGFFGEMGIIEKVIITSLGRYNPNPIYLSSSLKMIYESGGLRSACKVADSIVEDTLEG